MYKRILCEYAFRLEDQAPKEAAPMGCNARDCEAAGAICCATCDGIMGCSMGYRKKKPTAKSPRCQAAIRAHLAGMQVEAQEGATDKRPEKPKPGTKQTWRYGRERATT